MLQQIRRWSYNKKLRERRTKQSKPTTATSSSAPKLGILYESTVNDDIVTIRKVKQTLKAKGLMVKSLAFVNQKRDVSTLAQKAFSKSELTWDGTPVSPYVEEFLTWDFDILLCPIKELKPCLSYIVNLAKASTKIGCHVEGAESYYDIIIDCDEGYDLQEDIYQLFSHIKLIAQ